MAHHPIEIILLKQWASYIAVPMWIQDSEGNLIYYNEAAEGLLGRRFDDSGEIHVTQVADVFETTDLDGHPIPSEELPIAIALMQRMPAHLPVRFRAFDGPWREIEVTAIPVEGQEGRHLGVLAAFWERR